MKRFFVKASYGHFSVIDRNTQKMVVAYSKKDLAEKTAEGLNKIKKPENVDRMKTKLKTPEGYRHYLN